MKKTLLLSCAAGLLFASCSQDKPAATTTETQPATAPATTDPTAAEVKDVMDSTYRVEADRIAAQIASDANLTDTAAVARVREAHYERARQLAAARKQYATDTTGQYAALRTINDNTAAQVKTALNNSQQYGAYESNRGTYYDGPYTAGAASTASGAAPRRRGPAIDKVSDDGRKIKYANGAKIKRDEDHPNEVKIKRADGTKIKIDEDGNRTVKK
ncbi:hypothetical protein [Hymenobacter crusticola]|uniref:Centromere protein J C-terminal domain-containing protein n=1 Tax=Hymenobacter crusticola TaxID=1770526 RepID=A0A243WJ12_9BACT|nr:hypothetical protein [Hymenobacter crusticola]OUJ75882.1 hypothetical protein BXP70_00880 [Hymenobacter crusticola]